MKFRKIYIGSFNLDEIKYGLPNVYTSLIVIPGVISYICNPVISKKNKISTGVLTVFFLSAFYFKGLNIILHGFTSPAWFPYRYSFLFIFIIITTAMTGLNNVKEIKVSNIFSTLLVLIGGVIFSLLTYGIIHQKYEYLNSKLLLLSIFFVIVYFIILFQLKNNQNNKVIFLILIMFVSVELTTNGISTLNNLNYSSEVEYKEFVTENESILSKLPKDDIYRVEKNYEYNINDPLLLGFPGASHYSSNAKIQDKDFLGKLGYRNNEIWAKYADGSSVEADSLLGIQYFISNIDYSPYDLVFEENNKYVYENPFALPIAFTVNDNNQFYDIHNLNNPFEYINEIYNQLGSTENVVTQIKEENIEVVLDNARLVRNNNKYKYLKIEEDEPSLIHYNINNPDEDLIQFYFDVQFFDNANIYIDGKKLEQALIYKLIQLM